MDELGASKSEAKQIGSIEITDPSLPKGMKIVLLEGVEAVKQYTAGTKWCISNFSTFQDYCKNYNIYVISNNKIKLAYIKNLKEAKKFQLWSLTDKCLVGEEETYSNHPYSMNDIQSLLECFESKISISNIDKLCKEHSLKYQNSWSRKIETKDKLIQVFNLAGNENIKINFILLNKYIIRENLTIFANKIKQSIGNDFGTYDIENFLSGISSFTDKEILLYLKVFGKSSTSIYNKAFLSAMKKNKDIPKVKKVINDFYKSYDDRYIIGTNQIRYNFFKEAEYLDIEAKIVKAGGMKKLLKYKDFASKIESALRDYL